MFTYALAKEFRKAQAARETDVSFTELYERVNATMKTLRYDQISDVNRAESGLSRACVGITGKNALSLGASRLAVRGSSLRTASAWQAETWLQARLYNWIAFIAPNRLFTEVSN